MRNFIVGALFSSLAGAALAQTAPPPEADAAVIAYPASFFAPMALNTAYDMVRRIPGFTFDDGSAVRGFAGAAGNVLIDGARPASKTDDLAGVLSRIPAARVARIDLIRGGAPGIDMQGKTVVANVVLRRGGGFTGVAQLSQFTTGDGYTDPGARLEGTWRDADRSVQAAIKTVKGHDGNQASGFHEIIGPDGPLQDAGVAHNSAPNAQYEATAAYESPLGGGKLAANLIVETQPSQTEFRDRFRIAGLKDTNQNLRQDDAEAGLRYTRDLSARLSVELFGLQHLNRLRSGSIFVTAADNQDFRLSDHGGESIARSVVHWRPSQGMTIDFGGEFAFNWLATATRFSDQGRPIALPAANVRVEEQRGEAFATGAWQVRPTLTLEAGARFEASKITSTGDVDLTKTLTFPKPRMVATWSPGPSNQLRLRIEREVGQLDFNDFVASAQLNAVGVLAGNPNIVPQQDWAYEAAYERHFGKDGVVSLTLRRLTLQNVIDRVPEISPGGVFDEPGNIGGGHETDLVASFSLPLARLGLTGATVRGAETWRVSRVADPTTGEGRRISGQHPFEGELHFSQDLPRWKLTWAVNAFFGFREQFFRFDEIDVNDSKTQVDLDLIYKPRSDITLETDIYSYSRVNVVREVFSGLRGGARPTLTDFEDRRFGPIVYTRIRKSFG